jgi:hypothetical protein
MRMLRLRLRLVVLGLVAAREAAVGRVGMLRNAFRISNSGP